MEALIILFLIAAAGRAVWQQTKRDLAAWRNRPAPAAGRGAGAALGRVLRRVSASGAGYWGHQAAHGFPTARHGLHDGWMRGREAHMRAQRAMAQNRAEYAEGRVEHEPTLAELRQRRRQALAELERKAAERREAEYQAWLERERQAREAEAARQREREEREEREAEAARQREREEHDRQRERDEEPYDGAPDDAEPQDTRDDDPSSPDTTEQDPAGDPAGSGEGDADMTTQTETSYGGVKARMTSDQGTAEAHQAEAKGIIPALEERVDAAAKAKAWAQTTLEHMRALEVDGACLAAMGEHMEAHDAALRAEQDLLEAVQAAGAQWGRCTESAATVLTQLEASGHGNVNEAHGAAAGGGAQREFYQEQDGVK